MVYDGLNVIKEGGISDATCKKVLDSVIISEDEQTTVYGKSIYDVYADYEENELYIRKYTHAEFKSKYGTMTYDDLMERYS